MKSGEISKQHSYTSGKTPQESIQYTLNCKEMSKKGHIASHRQWIFQFPSSDASKVLIPTGKSKTRIVQPYFFKLCESLTTVTSSSSRHPGSVCKNTRYFSHGSCALSWQAGLDAECTVLHWRITRTVQNMSYNIIWTGWPGWQHGLSFWSFWSLY